MIRHIRSLRACEEIQHQLVKGIRMLPLRPVPAVAVDMQLRTGNSGEQAQTGIHRHKAIIASPDNQGLGFDFTQTRAEIRELFRVGLQTLDKVFQ